MQPAMSGFEFYRFFDEKITVAEWTIDAVNGNVKDYGLKFLGIELYTFAIQLCGKNE